MNLTFTWNKETVVKFEHLTVLLSSCQACFLPTAEGLDPCKWKETQIATSPARHWGTSLQGSEHRTYTAQNSATIWW